MKVEEGEADKPPRSGFERHLQTALLLIGVAILSSFGKMTVDAIKDGTVEVAKQNVHLAQIDERITVLQTQVAQTYRADAAARDNSDTSRQIADLQRRVNSIEVSLQRNRSPKELSEWRRD